MARLFSEVNEVSYPVSDGHIETPFGPVGVKGSRDGDMVILCLRQQAIRVSSDPKADGLSGRVFHVTFLGDDAWLDVGVAGFDEPLRVRVLQSDAFEKGTEVQVAIDLAKALVFTRSQDTPTSED